MFNIGGGELLVIMLIALIVLGPNRLPDAARQVGKTMGDLKRMSSGFQNEMKGALGTADDPTRVAARRNVLAKEAPPADVAGSAVDTVSGQSPAPARKAPLKAAPTAKKAAARATVKKAPAAKKVAKTAAPAGKKATTKAAATGKKTTKKAAPAVSKGAPRRTKT